MYKILMIVNPKAGRAKPDKYVPKITQNFKNMDYDVDVKYTTIENNATNIVKNYNKEYDVLIVYGGDGTLNEAIQGLYEIQKKPYVGFIPLGTTNDFAKSLAVSLDKLNISKNIEKYILKKVDTGIISNNIFNYVVSFGMFSKTSYATSRKMKNKFGRIAYILNGIKEVFNYKIYDLKIESDDVSLEGEFIYGSISNSKYIGGFNLFKKQEVKLDDGEFEALFVRKPKNSIEKFNLIIKILSGNLEDKNISYFKTSKIKLISSQPLELSIDGEYGGSRKEIEISNIKQNVEYILPNKNAVTI